VVIEFITRYLLTQKIKVRNLQIAEIFECAYYEMEKIDEHIKLIPEALPLFKKEGIKLVVVTTDSIKNTGMILEKLCLGSFFSAIVG